MRLKPAAFLCASLLLVPNCLRAEVHLPGVLASHMVVQRGLPVHVWGTADPGEKVAVTFRGKQVKGAADELGQWTLFLPPGDAGGPFTLVVTGTNTITLDDVLVGDLWFASGQSNMEFPMDPASWSKGPLQAQQEIAAANLPKLRLYLVQKSFSDYPKGDVKASGWQVSTPATVLPFSAVAFLFGRELLEREKVPIGLIDSTWGGTPVESWTSLRALSSDASLMPVFAARAEMMRNWDSVRARAAYEKRQIDEAKARGLKPPSFPWRGDPNSYNPAALYNAMVAPFTPLPIRGVIWYQGESNTDRLRAPVYERTFNTMIRDWRSQWSVGEFPFLFVQLANFQDDSMWPVIRQAQLNTLSLRNTAMAVTIDVGDPGEIHPRDKETVAHRLALGARRLAYGEDIEDTSPVFLQAVPEQDALRVYFDHPGKGLVARGDLTGFEVAGEDGKFAPADARIEGDTVVVRAAGVAHPREVRYAWTSAPNATLFSRDRLPASPFTSVQITGVP